MWLRLTEQGKSAVAYAQDEAAKLGENGLSATDVVIGCLRADGSVVHHILDGLGINVDDLQAMIESESGDGALHPADKVIESAEREARKLGSPYIGPEHLLLAVLRKRNARAAEVLRIAGVDHAKVQFALVSIRDTKKQNNT